MVQIKLTKPKIRKQSTTIRETEVKKFTIDFVAEEVSVKELFTSYATVREWEIEEIMSHFLKSESLGLFMVWSFWEDFSVMTEWGSIKDFMKEILIYTKGLF